MGFLPFGPVKAQNPIASEATGTLLEARVLIRIQAPGEAPFVEARYLLAPGPEARSVPISVLTPEPSRLESLLGSVDGAPLERGGSASASFELKPVRDFYFEGTAQLPPVAWSVSDTVALTFTYSVAGAWSDAEKATIPLLVPRWVSPDPRPSTFRASIRIPRGRTVTGSFPTSLSRSADFVEGAFYAIDLQSPPAMVVLRLAPAGDRSLTLEQGLDVAVLLVLLAMGAVGVRYLRRAG
jgi:hypothetical protein